MEPTQAAVSVVFSTDPLCSHSWALEPTWRKLLHHFRPRMRVRYTYGGLLPSLEGGAEANAKNGPPSPADIAKHWADIAKRFGQPIDPSVWTRDPVSSSYPASIAMHAARIVSPDLEEAYLRRVRRAVFLEARNIASADVLLACARDVGLAADAFQAELASGVAKTAFEADLDEVKRDKLRPFPTLVFTRGDGEKFVFSGAQTYDTLARAVTGDSSYVLTVPTAREALAAYRVATTREMMELVELTRDETIAALRKYGAGEEPIAGDTLWSIAK